jgi:small subunit ribosomal protein S8
VQILRVLYKEGFINGFRYVSAERKKVEIFLKYIDGKPAIKKVRTVSRPGRRIFVAVDALWKLETSLLTFLVSTPKGVLSDKQCRKFHQGGEILCFVF